jgi:hypothetical protein
VEAAMYPAPDAATVILYVFVILAEIAFPILIFFLFVWLAIRAVWFLVCISQKDGGLSIRRERQRHRMQNFAALMSAACTGTGIYLCLIGQGVGDTTVITPFGLEVHNVGIGVVLIGVASSVIWILLRQPTEEILSPPTATTTGPDILQTSGGSWFENMTIGKAIVVTIILLPLINIAALPVGAFLIYKAMHNN